MRTWFALIAAAAASLAAQAAQAALPKPSPEQVEFYRTYHPMTYPSQGETRLRWERDLRTALAGRTPAGAAASASGPESSNSPNDWNTSQSSTSSRICAWVSP